MHLMHRLGVPLLYWGRGLRPSAPCGLVLGVAPIILSFGLTLAYLPCLAWRGGIRGATAHAQLKKYEKCTPLFVHRQEPLGLGHT